MDKQQQQMTMGHFQRSLGVIPKLKLSLASLLFGLTCAGWVQAGPLQDLLNSQQQQELLPADDAFGYLAQINAAGELEINWQVAPGYYLYRDKLKVSAVDPSTTRIGELQLPVGKEKFDEIFGNVQVFHESVIGTASISTAEGPFSIQVNYQGCADIGVCYPPAQKTALLTMPNLISSAQAGDEASGSSSNTGASTPGFADSEQGRLATLLNEANLFVALAVFFGLGVLLSLNPCSYPMYPILTRIIVGQGESITRWRGLTLAFAFVLPMAVTYAVAGAFAALAGGNLFAAFQNPWVLGSLVLLLLALALSMFGLYELQLPASWQSKINNISGKQQSGTFAGAAIMGSLSALLVGACVLPPLVGVLLFIAQTGNAALGATALFVFGLGMGVPLLMLGASAGWLLPKAGGWMDTIKAVFGVLLLAASIMILQRILPDDIILLLWAALLIGTAVYLGALEAQPMGWPRLCKTLGILSLSWGMLLLIGGATGATNPLRPLEKLSIANNTASQALGNTEQANSAHSLFVPVDSLAQARQQLAMAKQAQQPAMLDFYADWCIPCKIMEREVFANPQVQAKLKGWQLLQADVTANDETDNEIKQGFDVFNPPSVLFYDRQGQELQQFRITGKINAAQFLSLLEQVDAAL